MNSSFAQWMYNHQIMRPYLRLRNHISRHPHATIIITVTAVLAATITAVLAHSIQVDLLPHLSTYGLSLGTHTRYCSIDMVRHSVQLSCQAGN